MVEVKFYPMDAVENDSLKYAVVAARYRGKWVFCRHKQRRTWEMPGGHRETEERIAAAAERELWEETGATKAGFHPVCIYSVTGMDGGDRPVTNYGMLYFAEITEMGPLPDSEIAEIRLEDTLPPENTYPLIQPLLWQRIQKWLCKQ